MATLSAVGYRLLATLVMLVHFAFVVFGGVVAWRWPRVIWAHLLVAGWGFSTVAFSIRCPLTDVENWARARGGEAELTGTGFIDHYIEGVLFSAAAHTPGTGCCSGGRARVLAGSGATTEVRGPSRRSPQV